MQPACMALDAGGGLEHALAQPQAPAKAGGRLHLCAPHVQQLIGEQPQRQQCLRPGEDLAALSFFLNVCKTLILRGIERRVIPLALA